MGPSPEQTAADTGPPRRQATRLLDRLAAQLNLIVFICLTIVVGTAIAGITFPSQGLVIQVLLGGFIGGITNKIAITMLFERKWYLPGSGVLLKKHQAIVRSLARTVEKHLVNSEMLQEELRRLLAPVNSEKAEQIINNVIDEFRGTVRDYLATQKVHDEVRDALRTKLGFLGAFLHLTRIKEYDEMTDAIVEELQDRLDRLRVTQAMLHTVMEKVGTLEDFLFQPNNELILRHYHTDRSIAQLLFDNIDIEGMVAGKLTNYAPSRVRDIIEENIRAHLLWLEVFGVLLGMLFAGLLFGIAQVASLPL